MDFAEYYATITPRYPELAGRAALVTGSGRGIGLWIAARLASEGMRVMITDRAAEDLQTAQANFAALGVTVQAAPCDLSLPGAPERLLQTTLDAFGQIDVLVNNAADLRRRYMHEVDEAFYDYQMAVNLKAPFFLSKLAAQAMLARKSGGCIVHISSVGGLRAHWRGLPYDLSKSAIDSLARAQAIELAEHNIRVNAVAPGATRYTSQPEGDGYAAIAARIPIRRFALALEIANVVAFLASPDASYITGQTLVVDGGLSAQLSPPGQDV